MSSRIELVLGQIRFAREYTLSLLADVGTDDWFQMPAGCSTHLAWQVGHLAMAQYGLCLFRMRGRADVDMELMSSSFRKKFSKAQRRRQIPRRIRRPRRFELYSIASFNRHCSNCRRFRTASWTIRSKCHSPRFRRSLGGFCSVRITKCCTPGRSVCCGDCLGKRPCDNKSRAILLSVRTEVVAEPAKPRPKHSTENLALRYHASLLNVADPW